MDFTLDNMQINQQKNMVIVSVNPRIYSMNVIFSASYIFIDKAYVIVDGDPREEIFVQIKPKNPDTDLEQLAREFNNELVNYSFYTAQVVKSQGVRELLIQRALMTHEKIEKESLDLQVKETKPER